MDLENTECNYGIDANGRLLIRQVPADTAVLFIVATEYYEHARNGCALSRSGPDPDQCVIISPKNSPPQ